jgi:hypothetical protein
MLERVSDSIMEGSTANLLEGHPLSDATIWWSLCGRFKRFVASSGEKGRKIPCRGERPHVGEALFVKLCAQKINTNPPRHY